MTSRQINVNMGFTADTSQAKANIEALKTSLNQLASITPFSSSGLTSGLQSAVSSAKELQRHLSNAFNVKTGNLDLSKLDLSLKSANTSLSTLGTNLLKAGSTGQQAFMNLQNAIATSNVQVKTANGLLARFGTTMMNTIKWQLSSSLIHGFIGGMRKAVNYVEDLNKSLNNIRIVTQYDTDRMAAFAKEANKAAKALSASTTAYTDASLIYFQQGLNEKQAKERADVTIKMSNVTRQSVEETSNQMTAIWNNFAKEGENLERFGDILTALGAKTASSTAEIAGGIEKFAGLANTIGLSYEYAASALATITAETRQSEDVVGTALKTIFARLQGLQLGETLEDGVSLNKYSEALHKVGVEVLDASGEMRSMDNILQDLSVKWEGLSKAQQTALAQTVAGVRQYTQLVTLMDNYDVMESNLNIARTAEGTLEAQREVYEQSIEAAGKRLKASAQDIYSTLLPEDAIYGFTEGLSKAVDLVADLLKGMGGLPGVLLMVSNIALTKMRPALAESINQAILKTQQLGVSFKNNITNAWTTTKSVFSGQGQQSNYYNQGQQIISSLNLVNGKDNQSFQKQSNIANEGLIGKDSVSMTTQLSNELLRSVTYAGQLPQHFQAYLFNIQKINNVQSLINESAQYLTKADQERLSNLQKQAIAASDVEVKEKQILETMQAQQSVRVKDTSYISSGNLDANSRTGVGGIVNGVLNTETNRNIATGLIERYGKQGAGGFQTASFEKSQLGLIGTSQKENPVDISSSSNRMAELHRINAEIQDDFSKMIALEERIKNIESSITDENEKQKAIMDAINNSSLSDTAKKRTADAVGAKKTSSTMKEEIGRQSEILKTEALLTGSDPKKLTAIEEGARGLALQMGKVDTAVLNTKNQMENITKTITDAIARTSSWGGMISGFAQGLSTVSMGINSIANAFNTIGNENASFTQKLMAGTMALTMGFRGLMTIMNLVSTTQDAVNAKKSLETLLNAKNIALQITENDLKGVSIGLTKTQTSEELKNYLANNLHLSVKQQDAVITNLINAQKAKGTALTEAETTAIIQETIANEISIATEKKKMLAKMGWMALAVIAIGLITAGIVAMVRASQAEQREYKAAAKAAKKLSEAAKQAEDRLKGISDAIDEYSKVVDVLENCTKGTQEWNLALEDVHNQVDSLLKQYPELLKYANLLNNDGTINQEVLEYFQQEAVKGAINRKNTSLMSQYNTEREKLDVKYQRVIGKVKQEAGSYSTPDEKAVSYGNSVYVMGYDGLIYDINHQEDGYEFQSVQNEETGEWGYQREGSDEFLTEQDYNNILEKWNFNNTLKSYVDKALAEGASNLIEVSNLFPEKSEEFCEAVLSLVEAEQASINILDNVNKQIINNWEDLNNTTLTDQQSKLMMVQYDKTYEFLEKEIEKKLDLYHQSDSIGDNVVIDAKSLGLKKDSEYDGLSMLEAYDKATGIDHSWDMNAIRGAGEKRKFIYNDENGQEAEPLSKEEILQTITNAITLEQIGIDDISSAMTHITAMNNEFGGDNILGSFIGGKMGSFGSLTENELEKIDPTQFLATFFNNNLEDANKFATDLQFKSFEDFLNNYIIKSIDNAKKGFIFEKDIYRPDTGQFESSGAVKEDVSSSSYVRSLLSGMFDTLDGKSGDIQNWVVDSLEQAFSLGGEELAESLTNALGPALEELDAESLGEVMNLLADFDWSQANAMDIFLEQLYEINPQLKKSENAWKIFANGAADAGKNLPIEDIDTFISQLRTLLGLLKDLKIGDVLKADEFNQLRGVMENAEDYFVQDINGNYVMTKEMSQDQIIENSQNRLAKMGNAYDKIASNEDTKDYAQEENITQYSAWSTATEGEENAAEIDDMKNILRGSTENLDESELLTIFGKSFDDFNNLLLNGTYQDVQDLLGSYAKFMQDGLTDAYSEENIQLIGMQAAQDVQTLTQREGYYDENGNISEKGAEQLRRVATETEGAEAALDRYDKAVEAADGDIEKLNAANKQLEKDLKNIQVTNAAKTISELAKEIKNLTGESKKRQISQIGKELKNAFGFENDLSSEWIEQNLDIIEDFTNGATQEIRDAAQQKIINAFNAQAMEQAWNDMVNQIENSENPTITITSEVDGKEEVIDLKEIITDLSNNPQVISCIANGDFNGLVTALQSAGIEAETLGAVLASFSGVELDAEGFSELASLYTQYAEALKSGDDATVESIGEQIDAIRPRITTKGAGEFGVNEEPQTPSGGGSGGDKTSSIADKRKAALEKERSDLEKKREGKYAKAQAIYLEKEVELLEKQNELLKEQAEIKKESLKKAAEEFEKKHPEIDLEFNDDGTVAGLSNMLAQIELDMEKAKAEGLDTKYFDELMEDFQEMVLDENDELTSLLDEIEDNTKSQAEAVLESITANIDEQVDAIDKKIDIANYYQEKLLNLAWGNKQEIEAMLEGFQYQVEEMNLLFEKSDVLIDGIEKLDKASKSFPDQAKMFNDAIEGYQEDLMDATEAMIDLRVEIEELIGSVLELAQAEIDIQLGRIDTYITMLDSYNNIIDLSGRATLDFANKTRIGGMKIDFYTSKMKMLKEEMDSLKTATKQAEMALEDRKMAGDDQSVKFWEYQVEELKKQSEEASANFLASWEEVLNAAGELYEARVEMAIQVMEDAISPYKTMDEFQAIYDRAKEIQERYLDDSKKLYELNKLNRQLNLAIADENDLLAKSKLRDLQQDILELQRGGVQMNQHDLDILQKKYDLRLAEIALMEAQNDKTRMRLVRDASGNYSYVYDADEQKIEDATQTYEDAVYALQELAKEYVTEVSDQLLENQTAYQEAIMNLDKTATDYDEQLLDTTQYYVERQKYLLQELDKAAQESGINFADTIYANQLGVLDYLDAYYLFEQASDNMIDELTQSHKEFSDLVEETMGMAGTSWETFGTDSDIALTTLEDHVAKLCEEIEELIDVLMNYVNQSISMVTKWQQQYSDMWNKYVAGNEAVFTKDYSGDDKSRQAAEASKHTSNTSSSSYDSSKRPELGSAGGGGGQKYTPVSEMVYDPTTGQFREYIRYIPVPDEENPMEGYVYDPTLPYDPKNPYSQFRPAVTESISKYITSEEDLNNAYTARNNQCAYFVNSCSRAVGNDRGGNAWDMDDWYGYKGYYLYSTDGFHEGDLPAGAIIQSGSHVMIVGDDGYIYGTEDNSIGFEKISPEELYTEGFPGASQVLVIPADVNGAAAGHIAAEVYRTKAAQWYDTGGYTGDWNSSEGRLAVLHEKEIVLNKKDTSNILEAVNLLRSMDLSSVIDKQVAQMLQNTNTTLNNLINQVNLSELEYPQSQIEQLVQINAEFPNATDRYEIQEALANLSNNASQYLGLHK